MAVRLRGEGNVVWEFELPLSEVYADQVRARKLEPVDEESAAAVADLLDETAGDEAVAEEEPPKEMTLAERIDAVSTHAEANELGSELGLAFEEKKPALDAKKQALHEAAAAAAGDGS